MTTDRTSAATNSTGPFDGIEALRQEAEADARAFAEGCDDLAAAIQRAIWARKPDKADLQDALNRYHLRLRIIEQGLHLISDDGDENGSGREAQS